MNRLKANLLFIRAHCRIAYALILALALIFVCMLFLQCMVFDQYVNKPMRPGDNALYNSNVSDCSKEKLDVFLHEIDEAGLPDCWIAISGSIQLYNEKGETLDEQLTAFATDREQEVRVYYGTANLSGDDLVLGELSTSDLFNPSTWSFYGIEDKTSIYVTGAGKQKILGFAAFRETSISSGIISTMDHFFDLTDTFGSIKIQFVDKLSTEQENHLIQILSQNMEVQNVVYPSELMATYTNEAHTAMKMFYVAIFLAVVCLLQLLDYLFRLRKNEYAVYEMMGASSRELIIEQSIFMLQISVASIALGCLLATLLEAVTPGIAVFVNCNWRMVIMGILIYSGMIIAAGVIHVFHFTRKSGYSRFEESI